MTTAVPALLNYTQIRERMRRHPLRQSEIPVEHAVSLPLPTKRFGASGYAFFSSPAVRRPGVPTVQSAPDRWWVLSALGAHIDLYTLVSIFPLGPEGSAWEAVELPATAATIQELQASLKEFEALMDLTVPDFFAGKPADPEHAATVWKALEEQVPKPLLEQYRALAGDFFEWLGEKQ
jgi:hypothetical protein